MKKKLLILPVAGLLCYLLSSYSSGPGVTGGYERTGASGTIGCGGSGCHSTSATAAITLKVELFDATGTTLVTSGYVGGTSYKLRVTGTNTGSTIQSRFGFQLSAVKTSSHTTNEGTLTTITGAHLGTYLGINVVEHSGVMAPTTGTGGSGTTYVVNVPWTAPAAGTGSVTAFATLNAVDNDGSADATDLWNNASLAIPEATSGASPITGTLTVCVTQTTALSDASPGGTWSSSNTAVATVNTTGLVSGLAAGTSTITYNVGSSSNPTAVVTVLTTPAPAAITGASVVCVGTHIYLSDATAGGTWSSSATTIASASTSGMVTGVAVGTATISYNASNSCGTASVTKTVTVKALGGTCVSGVEPTPAITGTELKVYPNPNSGVFTINVASADNTPAHVVITNITGAIVKEYDTMTNKSMDITLNNPAGIYFLSARTISGVFVSKVLTQ